MFTNITERLLRKFKYYFLYAWNKFLMGVNISSPPIFIVGCGHSGTSVLLAILDAHPSICAIPHETAIFMGGDRNSVSDKVKIFNNMAIAAGKKRWAEKTPKHILHLEQILDYCPDAKIIIIVRDGRDVAYSIKKRQGSLEDGIKRWCDDNLAAKKYWDTPNVYMIKYESIIEDFENSMTGIMCFLGEEYDDRIKDFYKTQKKWYSHTTIRPATVSGNNHGKYRNWQINQPLFDGRNQYKELSADEVSYIEEFAGSLLKELGYMGDK